MNDDIDMIIQFVEGRITAQQFEAYLYSSKTIQSLLEQEDCFGYHNLYYSLLEANYKLLYGTLYAQECLEKLLQKLNISYTANDKYKQDSSLILDASPQWLCADPDFVQENFLKDNPTATKKELKNWLLSKFKYVKSAPKWIQDCDWPIRNNNPLVFIGQLKFDGGQYFHDTTCFYLFFDPTTTDCETITQSY